MTQFSVKATKPQSTFHHKASHSKTLQRLSEGQRHNKRGRMTQTAEIQRPSQRIKELIAQGLMKSSRNVHVLRAASPGCGHTAPRVSELFGETCKTCWLISPLPLTGSSVCQRKSGWEEAPRAKSWRRERCLLTSDLATAGPKRAKRS